MRTPPFCFSKCQNHCIKRNDHRRASDKRRGKERLWKSYFVAGSPASEKELRRLRHEGDAQVQKLGKDLGICIL